MIEEQEVINFFLGEGWSKEDINKYKKQLMAEVNLFDSNIDAFTIKRFYDEFISKCDAAEYDRQCRHLSKHIEITSILISELIVINRRTNLWMFIMVILFAVYSFFLK